MDEQGETNREAASQELDRDSLDLNLPSVSITWTQEELESFNHLVSGEQPEPTSCLVRAMTSR